MYSYILNTKCSKLPIISKHRFLSQKYLLKPQKRLFKGTLLSMLILSLNATCKESEIVLYFLKSVENNKHKFMKNYMKFKNKMKNI